MKKALRNLAGMAIAASAIGGCSDGRNYITLESDRDAQAAVGSLLLGGVGALSTDARRSAVAYAGRDALNGYSRNQAIRNTGLGSQNTSTPDQVPNQRMSQLGVSDTFAYKYLQDLNGNGVPDYPEDFVGMGQVFDAGEPINLAHALIGYKGRDVIYVLSDLKGNVIGQDVCDVSFDSGVANERYSPNSLNPGKYAARWYLDKSKLLGMIVVEVK